MIDSNTTLTNVHVAGEMTFIPHPTDPKKHRCLVTVIHNRGKNKATGEELRDDFPLVFWGEYAMHAATYLDKGRAINVHGVLRSHTKPTGNVKPNGKPELQRNISLNVVKFEFGPETKKDLVKRINANLAAIEAAKANGTRNPEQPITAEELLVVNRPTMIPYNPQIAAQTGRYGNARVWIPGQGWLTPAAPAAVQQQPVSQDVIAQMKEQLAKMEALQASSEAAPVNAESASVDPFAG